MLVRFILLFIMFNSIGSNAKTNFNIDRSLVKYFLFHEYQSYENIFNYIRSLPLIYPKYVRKLTIGYSSEGREIPAIKISSNVHENSNRPIIFVDGGMHAREWMSVAVALYLIYQLVEEKNTDDLTIDVDWIIIPLLNPDGYDYSFFEDETWRKTMSTTNKTECPGVDINRNFDIYWNLFGASKNECSDSYAGSKPFSEPETRAFRHIAKKYRHRIKLYVTLHAYGSMILYPWSYTKKSLDNDIEHKKLGQEVAREIEKFRGTKYRVGATSKVLYLVSGSSCDWMAAEIGTPLIYAIELPKGVGLFQPDESEIVPTAEETFEGFRQLYEYVKWKWGSYYEYE